MSAVTLHDGAFVVDRRTADRNLHAAPARTRIVIGDMALLLRDILEDVLRSQPDMEIVSVGKRGIGLALERRHADLVILQDLGSNDVTGNGGAQVSDRAALRLVLVSYSGRDGGAFVFRSFAVAELSPEALVEAIRARMVPGEQIST